MFRWAIRTALLWITAFILAAPHVSAAPMLRIGVAGPLTGDQAAFGEMLKNGALLAVAEWNAKGARPWP